MTARRAVDFPEPDSPTSPTTLIRRERQVELPDRGEEHPAHRETHREVLDLEEGVSIAEGALEVEAIAQALAQEVETYDRRADGERGAQQRPERYADVLLCLVDHDTPIGVWRLGTQAEITQGGPPMRAKPTLMLPSTMMGAQTLGKISPYWM